MNSNNCASNSQQNYLFNESESHRLRFAGISRLYGRSAAQRISGSHIIIIGLGGVGSWSAESLCRSGVCELTLIDLDDICISNTNRQLHTTCSTLGQYKTEALKERLLTINPEVKINTINSFFSSKNAEEILSLGASGVIDAMDDINNKALLLSLWKKLGEKEILITTGATGGKTDPTLIEIKDLNHSTDDRLLFRLRKVLKQEHEFPRDKKPFNVDAIFSTQDVHYPTSAGEICSTPEDPKNFGGDCQNGLGSVTHLTGSFGFFAAHQMIKRLIEKS